MPLMGEQDLDSAVKSSPASVNLKSKMAARFEDVSVWLIGNAIVDDSHSIEDSCSR